MHLAKFRQKYNQFVIEGHKSVNELIKSNWNIEQILATAQHYDTYKQHPNCQLLTEKQYKSISQYTTPPGILALASIPQPAPLNAQEPITLVLDSIADPGNLGTLIRTAAWFGITQIIASPTCADFFNHKTLASTMGGFTQVQFHSMPLLPFLQGKYTYGALLNGQALNQIAVQKPAYLIIGSESHGISQPLQAQLHQAITIPGSGHAESLNAAIAGGIIMHHFCNS